MTTNTDPVRALIDLRDRVLPAAIRYQSVGPGYIEEAQRIVESALASAPPSAPVGVEWNDEAAWSLAARAEASGAERDSDDNGTWWTLRIEHFNTLSQQPAAPSGEVVAWLRPEDIVHLARQNGPAKVEAWNCASGSERVPVYTIPPATLPLSTPVGVDVPQLAEQARAWELVFCTLEEVSPGWRDGKEPAMYQAAKAIRTLSQQPAAPSGEVVAAVPVHYAENILAAACLLEQRGDLDDAREAKVLRKIAGMMRTAPQQPAGVDEGFVSRLADALTAQDWDVDPDGDGSGIAQLRTAVVAAQQQGGAK